jgi:hypothetical protein
MTHVRARLAALAILASVAATAAAPAFAEAAVTNFSCTNKPPGLWCDGRANGSFDSVSNWQYAWAADPDGAGLIVCEGLFNTSSGSFLPTPSCAANWTSQTYANQTCGCIEANVLHWSTVGNEAINGFADTLP